MYLRAYMQMYVYVRTECLCVYVYMYVRVNVCVYLYGKSSFLFQCVLVPCRSQLVWWSSAL